MDDVVEKKDGVVSETRESRVGGPLSAKGVGLALGSLVLLFGFLATGEAVETSSSNPVSATEGIRPSGLIEGHRDIRDTLFTTDSVYLNVDLARQVVSVVRRGEAPRTFLISSGTPYISDGMATPVGIYTVQNMVPMAISRQFNDARLHNWIGVYGGVGFHGLDGSGYYGYLGKRPSSHGCIRMSREEIRSMYGMIHVGAPIFVQNGETARGIAFCAPSYTVGAAVIDSTRARVRGLGDERIAALYNGTLFGSDLPRLVHLAGTKVDWRIESGRRSRIPRQVIERRITLPPLSQELSSE